MWPAEAAQCLAATPTPGFRLYREIPYDLMSAKEREEAAADGPADGAGAAAIAAAEEAQSRKVCI